MPAHLLLAAILTAPLWRWSTPVPPSGELTVRLVRGSVHTTIEPGTLTVVARRVARASDPAQIELVANAQPGAIELYARYPRYLSDERECLPPLDERGDFYHHDGRVELDVTVPEGWRVCVEILENGGSDE